MAECRTVEWAECRTVELTECRTVEWAECRMGPGMSGLIGLGQPLGEEQIKDGLFPPV